MRECIGTATIRRVPNGKGGLSPNRTRRFQASSNRSQLLRLLLVSVSAAALTALSTGSASAQANWTGNTSNDWMAGVNWTTAAPPIPGQTVNIGVLGAPPTRETVLGVGGPVSVSVGITNIGNSGGAAGNLTIQNGSTLTSTGQARIGIAATGIGTVTVTGPGSQWNIPSLAFFVGFLGVGTLNIQNGAKVVTGAGTRLTNVASSSGTVNISGGGTLETQSLRGGPGTVQANFDNGILRASAANATFINGFAGTQLNVLAGGLTIDTAGFAVGTDATSVFTGTGGLTVTGGGAFSLLANSSYSGQTWVQAGSTLSLQGAGAIANSSQVIADGTFNVSGIAAAGTSIQSLAGSGSVILGAKNLTITNANDLFSGIIGGTGGLTVSGGMQTLSGVNTYTGGTTVNGGTLAVNGSVCGAMNVLAGGTLQGIGTVCDTSNAGIVAPGNSIGTLTVAGNYTGNGGTLQIETALGGDASPTDRLVVTGNTAGSTSVKVTNVGGSGAQTVEGIKIVDVGGASNGTFSLLGNYVIQGQQAVVGGAYAYTLQKNGVSTPGDGDWYLRSSLINSPGDPAPPPGPLYQPGVPLYENYGQVLLGLNETPTLQQRAGNRYWGGSDAMARAGITPAPSIGSATPSAFWGRIEGKHADLQPSNTAGSTYKTDQMKVQAGLDGLALENGWGRMIVGLTAQYGLATANVSSFFGNGRIRAEGTGVGATATWYGDNGFYVDGQAQTMFYRSDLSSALVGSMTHGNQGFGYAFSVESGKRIGIGNGWSLTPQGQLTYSKVAFDQFEDRFGAVVSLTNAESLLGRAGLSLNHQKTWNDGSGIVRSDVYGIANLHYEFLNGSIINVAGTSFANANDRLWGSVGGGGVYSWAGGRYSVFGEVTYNASLAEAAGNHSYKGTGGFRVVW
jgi:outer membrane autotransporter protein